MRLRHAELLPPAAADCTAGKIDEGSRRRESGTKTVTRPRKRGSSIRSDKKAFEQELETKERLKQAQKQGG